MLRRIFGSQERAGLTKRDAQQLGRFRELGTDMSKRRFVDHFFIFSSEQAARAFVEELGEQADVTNAQGRWGVSSRVEMTLDEPDIVATRSRFEELAQGHGGTYDGWGAEVD